MTRIREEIARRFEMLALTLGRFRWLVVLVMVFITVAMAAGITRIKVDTSNESFLHADDPVLMAYDRFRDQFGRDDFLIIGVEAPDVFDPVFLRKLKNLHDELEAKTPYMEEMFSLINGRRTQGQEDALIVDDLFADWPENAGQVRALKDYALNSPNYVNRIITPDLKFTTIAIKLDFSNGAASTEDALSGGFDEPAATPAEGAAPAPKRLGEEVNDEVLGVVQPIVERYRQLGMKVYLSGTPLMTHTLKNAMMHDMSLFIRLVLAVIGLCLYLLFRRASGVILPFVVVVFSVLSTIGLMGWVGATFTIPLSILPSFLVAVGVGASVHLLTIFYQGLALKDNKSEAIAHSLGHCGLPMVITSLTTAVGLASFAGAEVAPISNLGIFSSVGVGFSLIFTIFLLPPLLFIFPVKNKAQGRKTESAGETWSDRALNRVSDFSIKRARPILALCAVLMVVSAIGAGRLSFSHDVVGWLPESLRFRQDTDAIDDRMNGTASLEVVVDTGRENGLHDPEILNALDRLTTRVEGLNFPKVPVGKAASVSDILKEINKALNENRDEYYKIPDNPRLIPQEFLLFENSGSDDLEEMVDSAFRKARFTIRVPLLDTLYYPPFIDKVTAMFREELGDKAEITVTGLIPLFSRTLMAAIHSAAQSYLIAFSIITILMVTLIGNLKVGLASMIPNLAPILLAMGCMGWFGFPLDMFTMLTASIAIGLAVDDTVHFMHNFKRFHDRMGDVHQAVRETLHTSGRAMFTTTVVLCLGFFIFTFSSLNNLFYFGLLTGMAVLFALVADYFVAPALMAVIYRHEQKAPQENAAAQEV